MLGFVHIPTGTRNQPFLKLNLKEGAARALSEVAEIPGLTEQSAAVMPEFLDPDEV